MVLGDSECILIGPDQVKTKTTDVWECGLVILDVLMLLSMLKAW